MKCILHPHKGYLNTLFTLFQTDNDISKYDIYREPESSPLETIELMSNVPHKIKIKEPGLYKIFCGNELIQEFQVIDGYKFGGSKYKKSYVSENTPWVMVVMNDRTYFHNRETGQEYVETISPDSIKVISTSFALFSFEKDPFQTLYSFEKGAPSIVIKDLIFVSKEVLIWKENTDTKEELCIVHLSNTSLIRRFKCKDFLVADEAHKLYCYIDDSIHVISFQDINDEQALQVKDEFITFVNTNYYVSKNNPCEFSIISIDDMTVRNIPITNTLAQINHKELININEQINKIRTFHQEDAQETTIEATYFSLEIFPFSQHIIVVETKIEFSITQETSHKKKRITLYNYNGHRKEVLPLSDEFYHIYKYHDLICLAPYYEKKLYILNTLKNYSIKQVIYDKLYKTPSGIYIKREESDNLFKLSQKGYPAQISNVNAKWIDYNLFSIYGIIVTPWNKVYNIVGFNRNTIGFWDSKTENQIVFKSSYQRGIISKGGNVALTPFDIHSEKGLIGLTIEDKRIYLHIKEKENEVSQDEQYSQKQIFKELYDDSTYRNVLLSEDGTMFLSRQYENTELVNIETYERIPFDNYVCVDSINGFRPTFKYDSHRQIRLINPLNGQEIDTQQINRYQFVSTNGTYYASTEKYEYIEYYNLIERKVISHEEYHALVKKYLHKSNIRTAFIKQHSEFFLLQLRKRKPASSCISIQDIINLKGSVFINLFVEQKGVARIYKREDETISHIIRYGEPLWFLNYVAFSYDEKYVAIAGKYPEGSGKGGLLLVYDLEKKEIVYQDTSTFAVWTVAFSRNDYVAAYTSNPIVYMNTYPYNNTTIQTIPFYSFLSFSPDGSLIAMSKQGYIPCNNGIHDNWGHQPSCLVSIRKTKKPEEEILSFTDLSDMGIEGLGYSHTVSSVSFSNNNKYIMMVGNDGVVIIRKLNIPTI